MNTIFNFITEKQYRVFLIIISVLLGLLYLFLNSKGTLATKYTAYFFVAPFFLFLLFKLKNPIILVAAPIFTLVFVENIILSRVPVSDYLLVGITLIFALTAFTSILWHKPRRKVPISFFVAILLYFFFVGLSMMRGNVDGMNLIPANFNILFTYYLEFLLFFLIGYKAFDEPQNIKSLMFLFIIFAALSGIGHIFSIVTGINLEMIRGEEMIKEGREIAEGNWRYGGFWGNVNNLSAFYVMIIPASIVYLNKENIYYRKLITGITCGILIISLIMGASRGGLLFVLLNSLVALFFIKLDTKKLLYSLIGVSVLVVVLNQLMDQFFIEYINRAIELMMKKGTDSPREKIYPAAIQIILNNPTGIGLATYNFAAIMKSQFNMYWDNPHNVYLNMLTQTGWGGFIAFMFISVKILYLNIKAIKLKPSKVVELNLKFIFLMLSGFFIMGMTEPIYHNDYKLNHIFGLLLGMSLFLSLKQINQKIKKNNL